MKAVFSLLYLILLLLNNPAYALDVVFELGIHEGDDTIVRFRVPEGEDTADAGSGQSLAVGFQSRLDEDHRWQFTLGYKEDGVDGSASKILFSRTMVDALYQTRMGDLLLLGVGPTWHSNVKLSTGGDGIYYARSTDFKDALGALFDIKFDIGDRDDFYLAVRLTYIEYETEQNYLPKNKYNGSSIGVIWGGNFDWN